MHKKDARTMSLYELLFGLCIVGIMLSVEVTGYILRYHVGIWFSYYLLTIYRWLPPTWTHQHPLGSVVIGNAFVLFGICCHLKIVATQLMQAQKERLELRLRKPSKQEQDQIEKAYAAMNKKAYVRSVPQW